MSEREAMAAAAAAAALPDADQTLTPVLTDPTAATTAQTTSSVQAVSEEKPSLSVLLCFLSFFLYCFVVWLVTSRVERAELPDLAQLEADTNTAVSLTRSL